MSFEVKKFRKKPVIIEAVQLEVKNLKDVKDWSDCKDYLQKRYFDKAYVWDKTRIYTLEMNGAGNYSYVRHWPDDIPQEGDLGEMLEILTQEFGERDEDGNVYDEPINFWISW